LLLGIEKEWFNRGEFLFHFSLTPFLFDDGFFAAEPA